MHSQLPRSLVFQILPSTAKIDGIWPAAGRKARVCVTRSYTDHGRDRNSRLCELLMSWNLPFSHVGRRNINSVHLSPVFQVCSDIRTSRTHLNTDVEFTWESTHVVELRLLRWSPPRGSVVHQPAEDCILAAQFENTQNTVISVTI